jgi:hypothetical protein
MLYVQKPHMLLTLKRNFPGSKVGSDTGYCRGKFKIIRNSTVICAHFIKIYISTYRPTLLYFLFIYLLFVIHLTTLFQKLRIYSVEWKRKWLNGRNLELIGRSLILRYYPCICLEGLRKTTKSLVGLRAEIWTRDLPNTRQEHYPLKHEVRCNHGYSSFLNKYCYK